MGINVAKPTMKCQKCEKPATFHITDLVEAGFAELHLCPDCAKEYIQPEPEASEAPAIDGLISKSLGHTAEELHELDQRECPICGITFYEFRQAGRLGCPHDYVFFEEELEPLLTNVHGETKHKGKVPKRGVRDTKAQTELIRLRTEMKEAVSQEDYELASRIRDSIRQIEEKGQS